MLEADPYGEERADLLALYQVFSQAAELTADQKEFLKQIRERLWGGGEKSVSPTEAAQLMGR